jgi:MATE family multidrug resistance protein
LREFIKRKLQMKSGDDTVESPTLTGLFSAMPLMAAAAMVAAIGFTDMVLAGLISAGAQAAVGISDQFIFFSVLIGTGLSGAISSLLSRATGAGRHDLVRQYARAGLLLAAVLGVVASIAGIVAARPFLQLLEAPPALCQLAMPYLITCAIANLPFMILMAQAAVFRAVGSEGECFKLWLIVATISIIGSLIIFFVIGSWGRSLTALGIAWIVGSWAGVIYGARKLKDALPSAAESDQQRLGWQYCREMLGLALPSMLAELSWTMSNLILYRMLAMTAEAVALEAAWSIYLKIEESFAVVPLTGMSMAASVAVGHNIGAGSHRKAGDRGLLFAGLGIAGMAIVAAILQVLTPWLLGWLTSSADVANMVSQLMGAAVTMLPTLALAMIFAGCLEGMGNTRGIMTMSLLGLLLVRLPLAWMLIGSSNTAADGLATAMVVSRLVMGAGMALLFARNVLVKSPSLAECQR